MKNCLRPALAAAVALVLVGGARAADPYPNQPIKIVVPFGPGSGADIATAVQARRAPRMNHGFIKHAGTSDEATQALVSADAWLRRTVRATTEDTTP